MVDQNDQLGIRLIEYGNSSKGYILQKPVVISTHLESWPYEHEVMFHVMLYLLSYIKKKNENV